MATQYRIFGNTGGGGPVDYGVVLATTASLTWASPALALSSDWKFAVRAFDTVSGLEEANVDTLVRVVVDAAGADVTGRPAAPVNLAATPTAGGGARVEWGYPDVAGATPTGFHVYHTLGGTVSYTTPTVTVPYLGPRPHAADLTGLTHGSSYSVGVRAYNAVGIEPNTTSVAVVGDSVGPDAVEDLTATAVSGG